MKSWMSYLNCVSFLFLYMIKSLESSQNIVTTLENMHRRLSCIENRFLNVLKDENPQSSDDSHSHENPFDPDATHWQENGNPFGLSHEQRERIIAAFEYTYSELFSDDTQSVLIPGFSPPVPNRGFHPYRSPLADRLRLGFMNDALGGSIPLDMWLQGFYGLSKAKNRRLGNFNPHAGQIVRDIVVRALLDRGMLSMSDTPRIDFMATD